MPSRQSELPPGNPEQHSAPWYQRDIAEDIAADADPRRHREPYQTDEYDENRGPGRCHEFSAYDAQLLESIRECLEEDPRVDARAVAVQIQGDAIVLMGEVLDDVQRQDVEALARSCADTKPIVNRVEVRHTQAHPAR